MFADQLEFYFHCKLCLVKDEKYYDRFDRAFAAYFEGLDNWQTVFDSVAEDEELLTGFLRSVPNVTPDDLERLLADYRAEVSELNAARQTRDEGSGEDGEARPCNNGYFRGVSVDRTLKLIVIVRSTKRGWQ